MAFEKLQDLAWSTKSVANGRTVLVPSFMDVHGWWTNWEKERFASMEAHLKPGMTFLDVGAYDGWQDAVISSFVGGAQNMVLVEPEPTNWPNIKATFERNYCGLPKASYQGFVNSAMSGDPVIFHGRFPEGPDYSQLISHTTFRHIDENMHNTSSVTLDALARETGMPDAINVDVEGAAMLVFSAGLEYLQTKRPLIWVSVHGHMTRETYDQLPPEIGVHDLLKDLGYKGELLANDHEEEWFYHD